MIKISSCLRCLRWAMLFTFVLSAGWLAGCSPVAPPLTRAPLPPTAASVVPPGLTTRSRLNTPTPQPVPPRLTESAALFTLEPPAACPPEDAGAAATYHTITAALDYAAHTVQVDQRVSLRNDSGHALDQLVFLVYPNGQSDVFLLQAVTLGPEETPTATTLENVRLSVPLPAPLLQGCRQEVRLQYTLTLPPIGGGVFTRQGYLGYSEQQVNLAHWLPTVAHYNGEWVTPPIIGVGEQAVLPAAAFDVTLRVSSAPQLLTVVGPGQAEQQGDAWRFVLPLARELAVTLSPQYHRVERVSANNVLVEVYTLDDAQPTGPVDAPAHALATAATAVELYSDLYGAYPYERLVVVESAFPDGMELSGLVFVGGEWFRSYEGDPASYLTLITAHEVAHQWWYVLVANDQATSPWLDEALATYSEYVFLEENYPDLRDWWWNFRVDAFTPEGRVDSTVYQFENTRAYINAVYLRGARLLHDLRDVLGGEAFFAWLGDYAEAMRGKVASAADLWAALPLGADEATQDIRQEYLSVP